MNLDFFKNKTILITGNTGFKGSWISEILYIAGANIIGYALEPEKESLYNILNLKNKTTSIYGDIRDLKKLEETIKKYKPEIIIHMAAQPLVLESYKNPHYTFETNIMGTINILEAIRTTDCVKSFLNVTTDKVYLDNEECDGYRETDKLCGKDPYSNSKSCSELVTYSYYKSFFENLDYPRISTARSGNVIGGGDFSKNRIIPDCINAALKNEPIKIRNPHSIRPYQHVLECLKGYLMIVEKQYNDREYAGNYNFGPDSKDCITTEQLVNIFCEKWGNQKYININENSNKESKFLKLNSDLAHTKLKWHNTWNIEKTIEKIIEWEKCYSNNEDIIKKTDEQIKEYFELGE